MVKYAPVDRNFPQFITIGILVVVGIVCTSLVAGIYGSKIEERLGIGITPINHSVCGDSRRLKAYQTRVNNAFSRYSESVPCHVNNGDEANLLYHLGSFSKGLQHDSYGHVNGISYAKLLHAATTGLPSDWDAVTLASGATQKFTNPQAGLALVNEGHDMQALTQPPAPKFSSAEQAGELVENYWMALARDVSFANYASHATTLSAVSSMTSLSDFRGHTPVTPLNLFRGTSPGCLDGPYISQFLYKPCGFGANTIDQRLVPPVAGVDFMKNMSMYLSIQNGQTPLETLTYSSGPPVFIRNGRDLSHWVHVDVLFQAYFHAMLILLNAYAPLKTGIPYQTGPSSINQMGFGTFGGPHIAQMATNSATTALKTVWYQKWFVHRRLRPEVMAARVHNHVTGAFTYPIGTIHADLLSSSVLAALLAAHGSYLLPQAFPEGSPLHPSYGAGHATVAGASVTILKAIFDEDWVLPSPVMPNPLDGGQTVVPLSPYAALTVGGELNKLAENIAIGRNIAGVHWRSDAYESLRLGEQIAIGILRDMKNTFNEPFGGWTFRNFDGNVVVV